ncbi:MAG TPA: heavy metal translocating P-type ATPase [Acidobacteriaceae bacterium]
MPITEPASAPKDAGEPSASGVPELQHLTLPVLGMTCAACQHHVEEALRHQPGVQSARVDLMRHRAAVTYAPQTIAPQQLIEAIRQSGYDAVLPREAASSSQSYSTADRSAGLRATITICTGAACMLIGMHPGIALRWALLIATTALATWAGGGIYKSAWRALLHRETNMNTLVSLGTGVALVDSAITTITGAHEAVYFDSVLLILGFLLLGKWLEARAKRAAIASVDALARLQPSTARLRRPDGSEAEVSIDALAPGDQIVILPGERIPIDGAIVSGRTTVDESMLTGEATPIERNLGDRILAGSLNYDGAITASVEAVGEGSTLRQIARLVEQAQGTRAPMERLADRVSAVFVPAVLALAVLTFAAWLIATHDLARAIRYTVDVLVIACPCAMGLAVPAALTVAIGRGSQLGILIKGGEALERTASLNAVALDKTGTITAGKPALTSTHTLGALNEDELLRFAASAEERSAHPLAHAVVEAARERNLVWPEVEELQIIPGRGLSATVGGQSCLLGSESLLREYGIPLPESVAAPEPGATRLWLAIAPDAVSSQYQIAGYFDARDTVRPTARRAVDWLQSRRIQVEMLTGDTAAAADPIANAIGIGHVSAGLLPADKVTRIRDLQQQGLRVGMAGDGINDAAALAQADAGIAMGAGAAIAQEAGDVLLLVSDPAGIANAIALARGAIGIMRQNLAWAAIYNFIGIPLAAGALYPSFHVTLAPWMAAAAMALSSVSVLANSLRLRGWRAPITLSTKQSR